MIQVIDENGIPIKGLFRSHNGALVVDNNEAYHKYIKEREIILSKDMKIAQLEERINKLAAAVELLQTKV